MDNIWRNNTDENLPNEVWKDIKGFEDEYMISNLGRVKSKTRIVVSEKCERKINGVIKLQNLDVHGYCTTRLSKNGKSKLYSIHRLVAIAFIKNPFSFPVINHKDEVKTNNRVENLEWCTQKYNTEYSGTPQMIKEINSMQIEQYDLKGNFIATYKSATEAAKAIGGLVSNICACCHGDAGSSYGFIWKFTKMDRKNKTRIHKRRVIQKTLKGEIIAYFNSIKEASVEIGCSQICIYACCNHKQKTTKGYAWEYADNSFTELKEQGKEEQK